MNRDETKFLRLLAILFIGTFISASIGVAFHLQGSVQIVEMFVGFFVTMIFVFWSLLK